MVSDEHDKDELSNYQPISNLSLLSKIIERVIKARLSDHLTSNNLLNHHQSAYRVYIAEQFQWSDVYSRQTGDD